MTCLPCHQAGTKPNACALAHYRLLVDNHTPLYGPWAGWRMAGRDLVAPDGQRIAPERLRGLLWRQESEARLAKARAKRASLAAARAPIVTVLRVSHADWHQERFGSIAG